MRLESERLRFDWDPCTGLGEMEDKRTGTRWRQAYPIPPEKAPVMRAALHDGALWETEGFSRDGDGGLNAQPGAAAWEVRMKRNFPIPGLGILPLVTIMEPEKVTRQDQFTFRNHPETCKGYEIHMGRTTLLDGAPEAPLNRLHDGRTDGYIKNERCWGSYLHGILDNDIVLNELAEGLTQASPTTFNYTDFKDQQYNKLAPDD